MKKLSILLIGLMLVAGIAFADFGDVSVSGDASVTWGIDLNTMATGFLNAGTSSVSITLIDKASAETTGDDGLYGTIKVTDYSLSLDGTVNAGTVSASIFVDPATIKIWTAPGMSWGNATIIEGTDLGPALTGANTIGGLTISVPAGPVGLDVYVVSDGDWTSNAANDYAAGLDVELAVSPATITLGGFYGWFNALGTWGATAGVDLDIAPAGVFVGFDIVDGGDWEVSAAFDVDLTEANADGNAGMVGVDVSYGANDDLDVALAIDEPKAGGFVDMLYATVAAEVHNLTDFATTGAWVVSVDGGYDTGDLDPYFGFGYGSAGIFDLYVGVALKAGLTGIDNTTISIDYVSTDLSTDSGIITVEAAISL